VNCGVENAVYQPRSNRCCGCGGELFRLPREPRSGVERLFEGIFWIVMAGVMLFAGLGWVIGVCIIVMSLPLFVLYGLSPVAFWLAVLFGAAGIAYWSQRPSAVAKRRARRRQRQLRRELAAADDSQAM
jgi:Flp pilus assembly protein TadB